MSYSKKIIASVLLVVTVFTFSACRTKDKKDKPDSYDGIELTYYKVFDDADVIEPIIDEYEAEHPGLVIHYKKFSDFDEYERTVLNEMAEGEGPDIFSMQNTWFASNFRKLAPMPIEKGATEDFAETFVDVAYNDLVLTDDDGKKQIFALPMTVDTLALYYNKDHFEDRVPTRGKPADTWEGIKEDVPLLNKPDGSADKFEVSGIAMGRGDNISRGVDILYLLFLQYGVEFYNENISQAIFAGQQGGFAEYPGKEALEFYKSFADEDQKHYSWNEFIVSDESDEKEFEAFAKGEVSMVVGYAYSYEEIMNQIDLLNSKSESHIDKDAVRIAPIPQLYDPDVSKEKRVTYASYFAETVSHNSEYPDIAWDFLIELTAKKNLEHYFDKVHKPTSRRDMIEDQKQDPIYGVFAAQVGFSESFPIIDYYAYKRAFSEAIDGDKELLDAQQEVTKLLPEDGLIVEEVKKPEVEDVPDEET